MRDHPRSRGVYTAPAPTVTMPWGSSPLARGLLGVVGGAEDRRGIIPARAGFTGAHSGAGSGTPDHPRSRGVYARAVAFLAARHGSSPLARGLRGVGRRTAGGGQDHPRSRGVYSGWRGLSFAPRGSSPLARGLHPRRGRAGRARRIIPARAGFTRAALPSRLPPWDHPPTRGVYPRPACSREVAGGSTPNPRG